MGCGNVSIPTWNTVTASECFSECFVFGIVTYCICGCVIKHARWREGRREKAKKISEKPGGGFSSEKGALFSSPSLHSFPSFLLSPPLPDTQRSWGSEIEVKEELEDQQAAQQCTSLYATKLKCVKNGADFSSFSIKSTHCHVDVLQAVSGGDMLNMAGLQAQSQVELGKEDYQNPKMKKLSA